MNKLTRGLIFRELRLGNSLANGNGYSGMLIVRSNRKTGEVTPRGLLYQSYTFV